MNSGLWALCMSQCGMQRTCWIGSIMSNFLPLTFQSNSENSLIAQSMLAAKTIPRCVLSLFVICFTILKQLASSDYKPSGVGTFFVTCFAQLAYHSVPCSSLSEHSVWYTKQYYVKRTSFFEQVGKELWFSNFLIF